MYDSVLPQSIAYRPNNGNNKKEDEQVASAAAAPTAPAAAAPTAAALAATGIAGLLTTDKDGNTVDPWDCPPPPEGVNVMPLITYFRSGSGKEPGWHRNSERRARGMFFVNSQSAQLEPWERQLVRMLILMLGPCVLNGEHSLYSHSLYTLPIQTKTGTCRDSLVEWRHTVRQFQRLGPRVGPRKGLSPHSRQFYLRTPRCR